LHNALDPRWIIDARKLNKNLILSETVFLNGWLSNTQLIDSVANGFNGLGYGAILQISQRLRLHGDYPGVFRSGIGVVFRKAIGNDGAKIGSRFWKDALDDHAVWVVRWVRLRNFGVVNFPRLHFLLQALHRVFTVHPNRIIHLYLQDQVGAAFEIEPEIDSLPNRRH